MPIFGEGNQLQTPKKCPCRAIVSAVNSLFFLCLQKSTPWVPATIQTEMTSGQDDQVDQVQREADRYEAMW